MTSAVLLVAFIGLVLYGIFYLLTRRFWASYPLVLDLVQLLGTVSASLLVWGALLAVIEYGMGL